MGSAEYQLFCEIVQSTFDTWKALRYAAANRLGGDETQAKLEWMVDTVAAFVASQASPNETDVQQYVEEILDNEFHLLVEDGSSELVASCLCRCFDCWRRGDRMGAEAILAHLRKANLSSDELHAQTTVDQESESSTDSEAGSGEDVEDGGGMDIEVNRSQAESHGSAVPHQNGSLHPLPPPVDGDWTVVSRHRRKNH